MFESEPRLLAAIVKASRDAIWSWDLDGNITSWNAEAERLFGYAPDEIIGRSLFTLIPEERLGRAKSAIASLLRGSFFEQYETVRVRKDGVRLDVELTVSPICDAAGTILGAATVCRDISARKQLDARLRLAIEAADLGVWDWNLVTREIVYSRRAKEIFGFPADAPVTFEQIRNATHPEDLPRTTQLSRRARDPALREKVPFEYRIIRPDGAIRWVLVHGEAVFGTIDGVERALRYAGCIQDITAQKQTADALRRSEARLRLAMDAGKMGVWEFDPATESLVGSREFYAVLGFPPDARPTLAEIRAGYFPGEQNRVREAARRAFENGAKLFETDFRYRWPDGSAHWLMVRAEFIYERDKFARLIGIMCDVTSLKQALEQQQVLIHELNHRVKNTLATVQSMAVLTLKTKPAEEFAEAFTSRLAALSATHDLLTASNWHHALIDRVIEAELEPYLSNRIKLHRPPEPILVKPQVAVGLGLVLHELATNAAKHGALSCEDGTLEVAWRQAERDGGSHLGIAWRETGGPAPKPDRGFGFGSRLIATTIEKEFGGELRLDFAPDGLKAEIEIPLRSETQADPGSVRPPAASRQD